MIGFICIFCILFGPTWAQFGRAFTSSIFIIISENPTGMDGSSVVQLSWDWKGQSVVRWRGRTVCATCSLAELDVQVVRWHGRTGRATCSLARPNWTCNLLQISVSNPVSVPQLCHFKVKTYLLNKLCTLYTSNIIKCETTNVAF